MFLGINRRLSAVAQTESPEDIGDVVLNSPLADEELCPDLAIARAGGEQAYYLALTRRQLFDHA